MFKLYEAEDVPSLSRSSSGRSSSSAGSSAMSKTFHAAPSRSEVGRALWNDYSKLFLDNEADPPLWDIDSRNTWDLEESRRMSDLVIGKKLHGPEQLRMTDSVNPYAPLYNAAHVHNASLQLNSTIASEAPGSSGNPRFKTEICRNFKEKGSCLYGDLCQFAHGKHELRKDVGRHNKYKTKHCQKYWITGYCAYGPRCNFIHKEQESQRTRELALDPAMMRRGAMFKTAAQVFRLASMRKASLEAGYGDSSGSDDGGFDIHQYVRPREDAPVMGLEKFPTFYPRNLDGREGYGVNMGPVGSGRPERFLPVPGI